MRSTRSLVLALAAITVTAVLARSQQPPPPVRLPSVQFPPAQPGPTPPARPPQPPVGRPDRFQSPRFMPLDRGEANNLEPGQVAYDGRFVFARLRYTMGASPDGLGGSRFSGRRGGRGQGPPWSHDYPRAERNFMKILKEITTLDPYTGTAGGAIVDVGSPDLFRFPLAYMSEPGFWTQTDAEAANVRAYLAKGGFLIFDDFRRDDWDNLETQVKRILPDIRFVELDLSHPIFHAFFDIVTLEFKQYYDRDKPHFMGAFQDNDPSKRLLLIANYNNDVGEYWEFSDTGWTPIDLSNEAYKLGVNYIIYGMTH